MNDPEKAVDRTTELRNLTILLGFAALRAEELGAESLVAAIEETKNLASSEMKKSLRLS